MMPVMNGRELCKTLKKDILLRHIPVIMLTGKGEVQDRISGIEAGADDYMIKPFDPDELLVRIKSILKRTVTSLDANPLSHLPGNTSIVEEFQNCIDSKRYSPSDTPTWTNSRRIMTSMDLKKETRSSRRWRGY